MSRPLEDYALIGDMHTAVLIAKDGSIDWMCLPRFDSDPIFAALLGTPDNGAWRIAPVGAGNADRRRYRDDTLILESEWDTEDGSVRITDFMPPRDRTPDLVRIVEGLRGRVKMRSWLKIRYDYGRTVPWARRLHGQLAAVAGPDAVYFRSDVPTAGRDLTTYADFTITEGERVAFVLTYAPSFEPMPRPVHPFHALDDTSAFWQEWTQRCTYKGPYRDVVMRSLITLKALTYAPTGGIVAAATTSLPEDVGGVRNWDYRYCWLRDATFTLEALLRTGFVHEAVAWRQWLLHAIAGSPEDLQIMYGVAGERRLYEWEVEWLRGYEGSRPVRVGNAAVEQVQLDVYGEVLDALYLARRSGLTFDFEAWRLQRSMIEHLNSRWKEPDQGIWEVRGPKRNFTHSKVMAWVAFDRGVRTVESLKGYRGPLDTWRQVRDDIADEVLAKGYDAERNTFTQYYGSRELDASSLLIPVVGFLGADDPRVTGTVDAIQRELVEDGFVKRYQTFPQEGVDAVDGLPGDEGAFIACSFWLVDCLNLIGRQDEASQHFERLIALRNDVGLLAEEYDTRLQRQVGNIPQAFSHVALVNSALNLTGPADAVQARFGAQSAARSGDSS